MGLRGPKNPNYPSRSTLYREKLAQEGRTFKSKWDSVADRLTANVNFDGPSGCWLWSPIRPGTGYGRAWYNGKNINAHRAIWMEFVGPIEPGMTLHHTCYTRDCVNPDHLEPMTAGENTKLRSRHCPTCECGPGGR